MSLTLPDDVAAANINPLFVETGIWDGGGVETALRVGFPRVKTIDARQDRVEKVRHRWPDEDKVKVYHGATETMLWSMIEDETCCITFWLDAHHGEFPQPELFHVDDMPILRELAQIARHERSDHTIMVDDCHAAGKWMPPVERIEEALLSINKDYKLTRHDSKWHKQAILVAAV